MDYLGGVTRFLRSKRVLVTGGRGFVGRVVCSTLNEWGATKELLGFVATTPFEEGPRSTIDWYVANREAAEAARL